MKPECNMASATSTLSLSLRVFLQKKRGFRIRRNTSNRKIHIFARLYCSVERRPRLGKVKSIQPAKHKATLERIVQIAIEMNTGVATSSSETLLSPYANRWKSA
jgi:hypothetical protein